MLLRFQDGNGHKTINLQHVWQVSKMKWHDVWSIRLDVSQNNYSSIATRLTKEEADDIEYKIIQGIMSKEDGVLEIT